MSQQSPTRVAILIPARFQSSRYPGKPLAPLVGALGDVKSLVHRSWECACGVAGTVGVWVATDDARIADAVRDFGGDVVMTSSDCRNGTERCADAVARLGDIADIIVNLQGDAPLTPPAVIETLVRALAADGDAAMATPAVRCSQSTYAHLVRDADEGRVGGTTVVANARGHALYFSKRILPYVPAAQAETAHRAVHLHLGVYAYRPDALAAYAATPPPDYELHEGLEQLRFFEMGRPIRVVALDPLDWDCIELNNPEDVPVIEAVLRAREIA
jgi:3-deoxy-manno-octulosonate cytidylyltransferase (CMP-KDO synthetase)